MLLFFWKTSNIKKLLLIAISLLLLGFYQLSPIKTHLNTHEMQTVKQANINLRLIRWKNTIKMIQDQPLFGVGPGGFEFGYLPYAHSAGNDYETTEESFPRSPHNAYLEGAVESGLPFIIFILMSLTLGFRQIFCSTAPDSLEMRPLALGMIVFLSVLGLTAFPLESAHTFYFAALTTGISLAAIKTSERKIRQLLLSTVAALSALLIGWLTTNHWQSARESSRENLDLIVLERACSRLPAYWRTCTLVAETYLNRGNYTRAIEVSKDVLKKSPNNYFALRSYSLASISLGNLNEGCLAARRFDSFFTAETYRSSLYPLIKQKCADY
jgi:hypothetical protein